MSSFQSIPGEEWRQVVGFPGYDVSDLGRVRSWFKKVGFTEWVISDQCKLRVLSPLRTGYLYVVLRRDNRNYTRYVHTLVLNAFVGPRPKGTQARHFPDPNKTNNRLDNLSWATPSVNNQDKLAHGTWQGGSRNPAAILTESDIPLIRAAIAIKEPYDSIAERFGVTVAAIKDIRQKRSWTHV